MRRLVIAGFLAISCLGIIVLFGSWAANAAPNQMLERQPALPGSEICPDAHRLVALSGKTDWHDSEIWAWDQICAGKTADFEHWSPKPRDCPPTDVPDHKAPVISTEFLQTVLAYKPFVDLVTHEGVAIECALFRDGLVLSDLRTPHGVWLERSTFENGVEATNFRTDSELSFDKSHFRDSLVIDYSRIGGTLGLREAKFEIPTKSESCGESTPEPCAVQALVADVAANFTLTKTVLNGHFNAGGIKVGGDLNLRGGAYKAVFLNGADIGGDLNTCQDPYNCRRNGATLDHLSLDGASIRGSVVFNGSVFRDGGIGIDENTSLDLTKAHINNQLELINVELAKELKGTTVRVDGDAFLRGESKFKTVSLVGGWFGGSLDFRGATFAGALDLSNVQVANTLILHAPDSLYPPPSWEGVNASLSLQNAKVESLQDWGKENHRFIYHDLKGKLDLNNFFYRQFGLTNPNVAPTNPAKGTGRLTGEQRVRNWLALQRHYDELALPQSFDQLANTLERTGYIDEARTVRIASRDHTFEAAETPMAEKILLFAQWITIRYGFNVWISLVWLAVLVLLGTIVGRYAQGVSSLTLSARLWFSLDSAIPLLELDERHKHFDLTGARGYFYTHRIIGFLLASFLVAGLSGLTK